MRIVPLTPDYQLTKFDCGDSDLNEFLLEDAKAFLEKRIANTFILEDNGQIAAYFCLLNDTRSAGKKLQTAVGKKLKTVSLTTNASAATRQSKSVVLP